MVLNEVQWINYKQDQSGFPSHALITMEQKLIIQNDINNIYSHGQK